MTTAPYTPKPYAPATKRLSQTIAEANTIAGNKAMTRLEITEKLAEMGFSGITILSDVVVASINGNTFRLG